MSSRKPRLPTQEEYSILTSLDKLMFHMLVIDPYIK
jgi:hypothetical protein